MCNGRVAVLCPTRGKPELFEHFLDTVEFNSSIVDVFAYVADDDPKHNDYVQLCKTGKRHPGFRECEVHFGPPLGYGRGTNWLALKHPGYSLYFTGEDDYECLGKNWDKITLNALPPDEIACVSCHYNNVGNTQCDTHVASFGGRWVTALGYISPPCLHHAWMLQAWNALSESVNRRIILPDLLWKHNGISVTEGVPPFEVDTAAYAKWRHSQDFENDVAKLARAIAEFK